MSLSRRELLFAAGSGIVATSAALTGCNQVASQVRHAARASVPPTLGHPSEVSFLNRYGFGPNDRDLMAVKKLGTDSWFESQLEPGKEEPLDLAMMVGRLESEKLSPWDLLDWPQTQIIAQMQQKSVLMATYSPWQLRERLVDFWTNHFNIYALKGLSAFRKPRDEREVVRAHALGNFGTMLRASAESTAMLVYLDQQNSSDGHPNENYARELMELHTLGVNGGYSQKDVMEVARCFTGWTEERRFMHPRGNFLFADDLHDQGEKRVLGHVIPANGGQADGARVLDILVHHPAAARHISGKLCRYFLGDSSHVAEADVTDAYVATGGDIKSMMRAMHKASVGKPLQARVKRPFDFIVSALRAVEADTDGGGAIQQHLRQMGQPIYLWAMPDGFPIRDDAWTGSMLQRWRFSLELSQNTLAGTAVPERPKGEDALALVMRSAHADFPRLSGIIGSLVHPEAVSLMLSSPEFQWH